MNGIFRFEYEGRGVLGIDTGLSAEAFARARLASLVTGPGYLVSLWDSCEPAVDLWRAGGTAELAVNGRQKPVMVVWGPDFAGLSLDEIFTREGGPASRNALEALAAWVRARAALPAEGRPPPWPGAALVDENAETVLFLPEAAARRAFDSGGAGAWIGGAERWTHPDYSGEEADVFTAAALLYSALSGGFPYPGRDRDVLREDIREGVFVPPHLAAPGLLDEPASLVAASLSPRARLKGPRPALADIARLIGTAAAGAAENAAAGPDGRQSLFRSVSPAEKRALEAERERFLQKREKAVKTGRFFRRNRGAILAAAGAAVIAALVAGSLIRARLDRPSTRGMDPAAVVESYYNAITALDHETLDACLTDGAGKDDVNMVTSLYVISKVRQAYEAREVFISPREWRENGGGASEKAVFGIGDLKIRETAADASGRELYRVEYLFFNPYSDSNGDTPSAGGEDTPPSVPSGVPRLDELVLEKNRKGIWHIAGIRRTTVFPPATD
ncbi:MAG: hypothetical protein LBB83_11985 [Treponema sp.]|jgi:hypothetical protein|nr:hypothetical protein [Treponema sp.]